MVKRVQGEMDLVLVLVVVLPMAPLQGPLRKCLCSVVLSTYPSHFHFYPPLCGRYQSSFVGFVHCNENPTYVFLFWE
jgi:hypothetical protein